MSTCNHCCLIPAYNKMSYLMMVLKDWRGHKLVGQILEASSTLVLTMDGKLQSHTIDGAPHRMAVNCKAVVVQQVGQHKLLTSNEIFFIFLQKNHKR